MTMDTANRAFVAIVVMSAVVWIALALFACAASAIVIDAFVTGSRSGIGFWAAAALAALSTAGTVVGFRSLQRQLSATERLAREVRRQRLALPLRVRQVAAELRLGERVDLVDANERFSFTYGFLRPRVALSTALVNASTDVELRAVLEHEAYHARNLDPAKLLAARSLPAVFFYLPVLRQLRERYMLGRELAADRRAAERCGVPALAQALMNAQATPAGFQPAAGAALGETELLPARISQLETGREPASPPLARMSVLVSAGAAAVVASLIFVLARSVGVVPVVSMPMTHASPVASALGVAVCAGGPLWVSWHVARWFTSRPRSAA